MPYQRVAHYGQCPREAHYPMTVIHHLASSDDIARLHNIRHNDIIVHKESYKANNNYQQRTFILFYVHLHAIITYLTLIASRFSFTHRCKDNKNHTNPTSFTLISLYCNTILTFRLCKKEIINSVSFQSSH